MADANKWTAIHTVALYLNNFSFSNQMMSLIDFSFNYLRQFSLESNNHLYQSIALDVIFNFVF